MTTIRRIEVNFPVPVELSDADQKALHDLLSRICQRYEADHPDRVMWVFGWGSKPTYIPMTAEEERTRGIEFDDDTLFAEISEREKR
jgi:hypothetical protein